MAVSRYDVALEDYNRYLVAALESCDSEKQLIISKIDDVARDQEVLKDIRETLTKQSAEVMRLQQELSEHRLMLQEEREKVARLMNENAVLMAQGEDDRSKIASLIRMRKSELTQGADADAQYPVRVSIMRPGGAASSKRADVPQSMSLRSVVTDYSAQVHVDVNRGQPLLDATIQPPPSSALVSALSREIEGFKQQLDGQRRAYENERAIRVVEERDRHQAQEELLRKYSATIDHLQALQNETTKELVTYRHNALIAERKLYGEVEALKHCLQETQAALVRERSRHTAGIQMVMQSANTKHQDVTATLRSEMEDRTRSFRREKDELLMRVAELTDETRALNEKLRREKRAKTRLAEQHKLENEGLQTEIHLMKQHLRAVEKKIFFTESKQQTQQRPSASA